MYEYKNFTGSIPEIIRHFDLDINKRTIYDRLRKGMELEKAIETPIEKRPLYRYKDFTGSVPEILKHFNLEIKVKTVHDRLRKGMTIEQSIETPLRYNITMKSQKGKSKKLI